MRCAVWTLALAACGRMGFDAPLPRGGADGAVGDGGIIATGDGPGGGSGTDGGGGGDGAGIGQDGGGSGSGSSPTVADTYLQGVSTGPWGSATGLLVGRASGGLNQFALFQFDLTSFTTPVTSATLTLYQYASAGSSAMTIEVHRVTQAWDEATANWSDASTGVTWTSGGGGTMDSIVTASTSITPGVYQTYSWDVTSLVNAWITGTPNYGLEVVYQSSPQGNNITFASREHANTAWRPQLVIVP